MIEDSIIEELTRAKKAREEAVIELKELHARLGSVLEKLGAKSTPKTGQPRANGTGVTLAEALAYAEEVRREIPGITQEELERRVSERAKHDGKSTKGLARKLRT